MGRLFNDAAHASVGIAFFDTIGSAIAGTFSTMAEITVTAVTVVARAAVGTVGLVAGAVLFAASTWEGADNDSQVPEIKDFWNPEVPHGKDWVWRPAGSNPGSSDGAWFNPGSKESLHPDLEHGGDIGPHWDHTRKGEGKSGGRRIFPDGTVKPK